jgi:hypothetical protein
MEINAQRHTYDGFMRFTKLGIAGTVLVVALLLWMYLP